MDVIKAEKQISKWLRDQMAIKHLKQEECAKVINTSQGAYSRKLNVGDFTFAEIVTLVKAFDLDLEGLVERIKG